MKDEDLKFEEMKTTKCKGNRIRSCHIISNSFSTPSSTLTKRWYSSSERFDHLRISSLTVSKSGGSVTSDEEVRSQDRSHHEILLRFSSSSYVATFGVLSTSEHHLPHGQDVCLVQSFHGTVLMLENFAYIHVRLFGHIPLNQARIRYFWVETPLLKFQPECWTDDSLPTLHLCDHPCILFCVQLVVSLISKG
jgi:hypothetical protein